MIGGQDSAKGQGSYTIYTGLGAVQLLAVNPSETKYKEITGQDPYYDLDYSKKEGFNDDTIRPVTFLYKRVVDNTFGMLTINLSNKEVTSKNGKKKFVDDLGRISYYIDDINKISPKFKFNIDKSRPIYYGEEQYLQIIKSLFRYSPNSPEARLMGDLKEHKASFSDIYKGNYEGVNKIIQSLNPDEYGISLLFTAKSKDDKFYQRVSTNPETIGIAFPLPTEDSLVVPAKHVERVAELHETQKDLGYPLSKDLYTVRLQEFSLEDCLNYDPSEAVDDFGEVANADFSPESDPFGTAEDEDLEDYF